MARNKSSSHVNKMLSARQLLAIFVAWFVGHSLVIYTANRFFPEDVVLGTHFFSPFQALIYSMVVFTLITVGAIPVIEHLAEMNKKKLMTMDWMVAFFAINAAGLWVVARFAEQLGLGISSWVVAAVLAIILDFVQGFLVMRVTGNGK